MLVTSKDPFHDEEQPLVTETLKCEFLEQQSTSDEREAVSVCPESDKHDEIYVVSRQTNSSNFNLPKESESEVTFAEKENHVTTNLGKENEDLSMEESEDDTAKEKIEKPILPKETLGFRDDAIRLDDFPTIHSPQKEENEDFTNFEPLDGQSVITNVLEKNDAENPHKTLHQSSPETFSEREESDSEPNEKNTCNLADFEIVNSKIQPSMDAGPNRSDGGIQDGIQQTKTKIESTGLEERRPSDEGLDEDNIVEEANHFLNENSNTSKEPISSLHLVNPKASESQGGCFEKIHLQ